MKEMKRDPVGVVCVDDYMQSSWQYGGWLRAAETLLAVWNLFSSAAVLWVLVSSSERCVFIVCWSMYYVCVMHNRHTLVVDEEVEKRSAEDTFCYAAYFNHWLFFLKSPDRQKYNLSSKTKKLLQRFKVWGATHASVRALCVLPQDELWVLG